MRKAIGAMTLAVMVVLLAAVPAQAGSSDESEFLQLLNQRRASRGLRALAMKSDLVSIARRQSARMESRGDIYHNPRLAREVSGEKEVGENVGVGPDVPGLDQAFWESAGHRSNIVYSKYNQVGIGVVRTRFDVWVTVVFVHRPTTPPPTPPTVDKTPPKPPVATAKPATSPTRRPVLRQAQAAPTAPRTARSDASRGASAPLREPERSVDLLVRTVALDAA
jgi:hypothetical protein